MIDDLVSLQWLSQKCSSSLFSRDARPHVGIIVSSPGLKETNCEQECEL